MRSGKQVAGNTKPYISIRMLLGSYLLMLIFGDQFDFSNIALIYQIEKWKSRRLTINCALVLIYDEQLLFSYSNHIIKEKQGKPDESTPNVSQTKLKEHKTQRQRIPPR